MTRLTETEITNALPGIPGWTRTGSMLTRTCVFEDFPKAMHFVNQVAVIAEDAEHHPDIDIRWNRVVLALTTHDAGGLTASDFAVAARIDALTPG